MSVMMVAKLANVPYSTAWRVINGRTNVSPAAVERVLQAAKQIGFEPGNAGRGRPAKISSGIRTHNVALLHLRTDTTLSLSLLRMVEQLLSARNLNLIVGHVSSAEQLPQAVRAGNVDGILGYGQFPQTAVMPRLLRIPAVWMMTRSDLDPDPWGDRVLPNSQAIGALAARHLLDRRHEHLGYIDVPSGMSAPAPARADRSCAFAAVAEGKAKSVQVISSEWSPSPVTDAGASPEVAQIVERWQRLEPRPTGLFVPTDRLTLLVQRELRSRGVRLGNDVEIVSCDNEPELLSQMDPPAPPSIDLNRHEIARQAIERLVWRMRHGNASPQVSIAVQPSLAGVSEPANAPASTALAT